MVNQSTDYFSICTNGTNGTNRPFVFARLTSVMLMRCISPMEFRLTIRSNGTNRTASLTNRNLLLMVRFVRVF